SAMWFIGCAVLILLRRSALFEGRVLALTLLLAQAGGGFGGGLVVHSLWGTALLFTIPALCSLGGMALLVFLSARFGRRTGWRRVLEIGAYTALALCVLDFLVFHYGLDTLWIDPLVFGWDNFNGNFGL